MVTYIKNDFATPSDLTAGVTFRTVIEVSWVSVQALLLD
jgi:hypothetical protein